MSLAELRGAHLRRARRRQMGLPLAEALTRGSRRMIKEVSH